MKIIEKAIAIGLIFTVLISLTGFKARCESIEEKVLRLHVLANSDSQEDQELKLKVRDRILEYSGNIFINAIDKSDAENLTSENLDKIKNIALKEIHNQGYAYDVKVELKNTHFNTRVYNEVTLPAGNYDALRVLIGDGKGKNWWCVMFPPMCLPAAEEKGELDEILDDSEMAIVANGEKYEFKFKIVEWFEEIKNTFET